MAVKVSELFGCTSVELGKTSPPKIVFAHSSVLIELTFSFFSSALSSSQLFDISHPCPKL